MVALLGHGDADVRRAAAEVLVQLGAAQFEPIAQRLAEGRLQSPAAAAYAVGELLDQMRPAVFYHPQMDAQSLAAATRPVLRLAAPALIGLLGHPDAEVRQTAMQALSHMGLLAAPFLLQSLKADDAAVHPVAIDALSRLESYLPSTSPANAGMEVIKAKLIPPLMELMKHPDP